MNITIHTGYRPGAIGQVVQLHAEFYAREAGFGLPFEAKVAAELSEFMGRYNDATDLLLLALVDGEVQASLAIDGAKAGSDGAHLRWFIVSDTLRGQGVGTQLLANAVAFVESRRFAQTYLWTFDDLNAARHLYLKFGFRLVHEAKGQQWGKVVNEQRYLRSDGAGGRPERQRPVPGGVR